jgi:hypothetical protein
MHASCSAFSVTEFYDSQLVQEAEILNNLIALFEGTTALEQNPSIGIKLSHRKNKHDLSGMPNRCPLIPVTLIVILTPLTHFYGTRLYL